MKKNRTGKASLLLILATLLSLSLVFSIASCGGGNHQDDDSPVSNKDLKINCVVLSRAQVQSWVDSGWTKPGSQGQINEIILQFFSSEGNSNFQLIGYPGNSPVSVKDNGKITLANDTTCKSEAFSNGVVLGNNIMKLNNLGIFDKEGNLNPFDYIRLTPEQQYPPYVNFKVIVVTNSQTSAEDQTRPCPAWCF